MATEPLRWNDAGDGAYQSECGSYRIYPAGQIEAGGWMATFFSPGILTRGIAGPFGTLEAAKESVEQHRQGMA